MIVALSWSKLLKNAVLHILTSSSTFSPEGRLFQVEYSLEAIKLGSTAIGVATGSGVILGVEKRVTSTLLETSSVEKIVEIDRHIGCAMSGLQADARSMVEHARVESQNHAFHYNEPLRVESCTQSICDLAIRFGEGAEGEESIMSRPFGVALLVAGIDEDGPQLYVLCSFPVVQTHNSNTGHLIIGTTPNPQVLSTAMTPKPSDRARKALKPNCKMNSTNHLPSKKPKRWY
ncbi:MAG: hypothetical protein Q9180_003558 [Flavoplaca navasiana]